MPPPLWKLVIRLWARNHLIYGTKFEWRPFFCSSPDFGRKVGRNLSMTISNSDLCSSQIFRSFCPPPPPFSKSCVRHWFRWPIIANNRAFYSELNVHVCCRNFFFKAGLQRNIFKAFYVWTSASQWWERALSRAPETIANISWLIR